MKLHLGCGGNYKNGWVNVDLASETADMHVDLCSFPWPWEDGAADEVFMEHVIEHFERPELVLKEIHRILRPEGSVTLIMPHKESVSANVPDHKSFFSYAFFHLFTQPEWYWIRQNNDCWFEPVSYRVLLFKQSFLKWTPFDCIASRFPYFWEKFSFGGLRPTEIIWKARKPLKNENNSGS